MQEQERAKEAWPNIRHPFLFSGARDTEGYKRLCRTAFKQHTKAFFIKYSLVLHQPLGDQTILGDQYTPKEKRKEVVKHISPLSASQFALPEEQSILQRWSMADVMK